MGSTLCRMNAVFIMETKSTLDQLGSRLVPHSPMSNELMKRIFEGPGTCGTIWGYPSCFFKAWKRIFPWHHTSWRDADTCQVGQWPIMGCKVHIPWSKESLVPRKRSRTVSLGREQEDDWRPCIYEWLCSIQWPWEHFNVRPNFAVRMMKDKTISLIKDELVIQAQLLFLVSQHGNGSLPCFNRGH